MKYEELKTLMLEFDPHSEVELVQNSKEEILIDWSLSTHNSIVEVSYYPKLRYIDFYKGDYDYHYITKLTAVSRLIYELQYKHGIRNNKSVEQDLLGHKKFKTVSAYTVVSGIPLRLNTTIRMENLIWVIVIEPDIKEVRYFERAFEQAFEETSKKDKGQLEELIEISKILDSKGFTDRPGVQGSIYDYLIWEDFINER